MCVLGSLYASILWVGVWREAARYVTCSLAIDMLHAYAYVHVRACVRACVCAFWYMYNPYHGKVYEFLVIQFMNNAKNMKVSHMLVMQPGRTNIGSH